MPSYGLLDNLYNISKSSQEKNCDRDGTFEMETP